MNITLSKATLDRVIRQSTRIIWILDDEGNLVWCSEDAKTFLGMPDSGAKTILQSGLFVVNERFREFMDLDNPLDKIVSIQVDSRNVVCRKEHISIERQIVCSVISDTAPSPVDELAIEMKDSPVIREKTEDEMDPQKLFWGDSKDILREDISTQVDQTMAVMGKTIDVDRAYIFQYDWEKETMSNTHEWCAEGVSPEIENLQELPNTTFPWWQKKLELFEPIIINELDEFPEEASEEKMILNMQGIQSIMVFPIISKRRLYGFLGFDSVERKRTWEASEVDLLKMYSRLVATMIDNTRLMRNIIEGSERNQQLVDTVNMPVLIIDDQGRMLSKNRIWEQLFPNDEHELNHIFDYVVKEQLGRFRNNLNSLISGEKKAISGALFALESHRKEIRQMELHAISYKRDGRTFYLLIFQDITRLLDYQANLDKLSISNSQIFLRFSDVFCKLYSGFDFEWNDHYLTSKFCIEMAQRLGLNKTRTTGLYIAALLQNIGKMMLPKKILLKSEKLTEEERVLVRKYIVDGADVLNTVEFPWQVTRIISDQFEHYDGTGYPKGISGEQLLIESQIMFAANMFISLTESQVYRDPFSVPEALAMMREQSGKWYETSVFDVVEEIVEDNLGRLRLLKRNLQDINLTDYLDFSR